ncbi:hypothetical protein F5887DRAFT_1084097 [Amanita rubescens]|nr:hypothetical protein F5887DRAFT_1084097 [Amanita rubescens]
MHYDLTGPLSPLTELSDGSTSAQPLSSLSQLGDDFLKTVLVLMNNATPTVGHVVEANAQLDVFENVPMENRRVGTEIDSLRVLREMLNNAPTDRGKRYVACAVICCQGPEQWVRLASDWVHFLLWPFKSAYKSKSPCASPHSVITLPETEASITVRRDEHFLCLLKERQGNKCAVIVKPPGRIKTIGTHIIRRSIAKADNSNAGLHISLPATWDILRHYADLSEDTIRDLENIIDSPSNGILLQTEMHDGFDNFEWCFEATDQPNVYNIKWLSEDGPLGAWVTGGLDQVQFTNQSANDIPLPNAQFLAIHAAIARVLHLSGAAEPLDLVMDRFDSGSSSPVPSGKYGSADLAIRWSLLELFGDNLTHLPTEIRAFGNRC